MKFIMCMARPQQHSVECIGSPQPNYSHYQQQSHALLTAMPPVSPSQFNGSHMPPPGSSVYPQLQSQDVSPVSPSISESNTLSQSSHSAHVPPVQPNLTSVNSGGAYPLANITALSPPSISWITHTQSPPLHPFPPPLAPLTHVHHLQQAPPRLTHSPGSVPPSACGYAYHDPTFMQMQSHPSHSLCQVQHTVQDISSLVHSGNLHMQNGTPSHQLLSPPPPGYHHHHHHHHEPIPLPSPHPTPHLHGPPLHSTLPVVQEGWMGSPPPHQQFYHLPTGLSHPHSLAMPHQPHPQPLPPPHVRMQFLPHTPPMQATSRIRRSIVNWHSFSQLAASQVSEQMSSKTVQILQPSLHPSLQPVSMSTVVRPTPTNTNQPIHGYLQSTISEPGFPATISGPSPLGQQVTMSQQLGAQQQWMTVRSQAMPPTCLQTSALPTTPSQAHQGNASDTEQTQPLSIPMSSQEVKEWDEYKEFAAIFRNHRTRLSYTLEYVIKQIQIRFEHPCSSRELEKFEEVQLSLAEVRELMPVLQEWLKDTLASAGTSEEGVREVIAHATTSINPRRERKRRRNVDSIIKEQLEEEFRRKRTPSQSEMQAMANRFRTDKDFVRVWFCNRRQRQKKLEKDLKEAQAKQTPIPSSPKATIPSPSHDIMVMVPSIDPRDAGSPIHEGYKFRRIS